MKNHRVHTWVTMSLTVTMLSLLGLLSLPAQAQADSDKATVLERMKQRFPQMLAAKRKGEIGEMWSGYVAVPPAAGQVSQAVKKIVADENKDRKALYRILAKELNVSEATVASNNRTRIYKQAEKGAWLQTPQGNWTQRK